MVTEMTTTSKTSVGKPQPVSKPQQDNLVSAGRFQLSIGRPQSEIREVMELMVGTSLFGHEAMIEAGDPDTFVAKHRDAIRPIADRIMTRILIGRAQ